MTTPTPQSDVPLLTAEASKYCSPVNGLPAEKYGALCRMLDAISYSRAEVVPAGTQAEVEGLRGEVERLREALLKEQSAHGETLRSLEAEQLAHQACLDRNE